VGGRCPYFSDIGDSVRGYRGDSVLLRKPARGAQEKRISIPGAAKRAARLKDGD
jgi:hypothetical protein